MLKKLFLVASTLAISFSAYAGKVESVQAEVKKSCNKDISSEEALPLVKSIFLSCSPGSKVDTPLGCKVNCLKENSGAVVGG